MALAYDISHSLCSLDIHRVSFFSYSSFAFFFFCLCFEQWCNEVCSCMSLLSYAYFQQNSLLLFIIHSFFSRSRYDPFWCMSWHVEIWYSIRECFEIALRNRVDASSSAVYCIVISTEFSTQYAGNSVVFVWFNDAHLQLNRNDLCPNSWNTDASLYSFWFGLCQCIEHMHKLSVTFLKLFAVNLLRLTSIKTLLLFFVGQFQFLNRNRKKKQNDHTNLQWL